MQESRFGGKLYVPILRNFFFILLMGIAMTIGTREGWALGQKISREVEDLQD